MVFPSPVVEATHYAVEEYEHIHSTVADQVMGRASPKGPESLGRYGTAIPNASICGARAPVFTASLT